MGCGVSGGEEGALNGPSIMPGGSADSWNNLKDIFEAIAAKDFSGKPCVTHIGTGSAGHFVKTVHNGIEYGIMQILAESYQLLKEVGKLNNKQLASFYANLNDSRDLKSFLIEITAQIFKKEEDGNYVIDIIKDAAGQKGTGKWTTESALHYGVAIPTINAAVDARIISGSEALRASIPKRQAAPEQEPLILETTKDAIELSIITTYLQGFELLKVADQEEGWGLDFKEIMRIWQGGCIIRSALLEDLGKEIKKLYKEKAQTAWRKTVAIAATSSIPVPAMGASLAYFDALRSISLPQNLTQAQRDLFGAHTYKRIDKEGTFHTDWD